ncbi:MAG TPA: undecaprenyl-diphosphate phosphatase [Solirubrobacteraceae bacterium]|jgi:undecaprenyl-diphosphatase
MLRDSSGLPLRHAFVLGLAQGPTELLPVSSSAHTTLIPLLLGWPYGELDGERRKSFELALHAGAGIALALDMRRELVDAALRLDARRAGIIALSLLPPALAGVLLRGPIQRRLGRPDTIAVGLAAGGVAMGLADAFGPAGDRAQDDARPADGLALGLAQALALVPGISRYGATLTIARARGFSPVAAQELSWHAALPVVLGASAIEAASLATRPPSGSSSAPLAIGAAGAFVSTSLSARVLRRPRRAVRSLLPFALYRLGVAALLLGRRGRALRAQ